MPLKSLTKTEREVLRACRILMAEVAKLPEPPEEDFWGAEDLREQREYGPRYAPSRWFNGGIPLSNRRRVMFLRAAHRLCAAGLLVGTNGEGGRLAHLKLTEDGQKALKSKVKKK